MSLAWLLLQFLACALLIARAGLVLCRSADALAQAHGWGRGWVGLALLATVTSLPELAGFGVVMLGLVALSLVTGHRAPALLHVGVYSPLLLALYLLALKAVHAHEHQAAAPPVPAQRAAARHTWRSFGLAALVVLASDW